MLNFQFVEYVAVLQVKGKSFFCRNLGKRFPEPTEKLTILVRPYASWVWAVESNLSDDGWSRSSKR